MSVRYIGTPFYCGVAAVDPATIDALPVGTRQLKFRSSFAGAPTRVTARLADGVSLGVLEKLESGRFKFLPIAGGTQHRKAVAA